MISTPSHPTPKDPAITLFEVPRLATDPVLIPLIDVINRAFSAQSRNRNKNLVDASVLRFPEPGMLIGEFGPECFTFVAYVRKDSLPATISHHESGLPDDLVPIGCASAKPFKYVDPEHFKGPAMSLPWKRSRPKTAIEVDILVDDISKAEDKGTEGSTTQTVKKEIALPQWEILSMAIEPDLQKAGLATKLLNLTIEEIQRRVTQAQPLNVSQNGSPTVELLLSTIKETNEEYYAKRGWTTTDEKRIEPGTVGRSGIAFSIVEMVRLV